MLTLPEESCRELHWALRWLKCRFQLFHTYVSDISTHHLRIRGILGSRNFWYMVKSNRWSFLTIPGSGNDFPIKGNISLYSRCAVFKILRECIFCLKLNHFWNLDHLRSTSALLRKMQSRNRDGPLGGKPGVWPGQ